eukprot:SAG11_NODE_1343_length_5150_cov_16.835280_2_plen_143_part_00
MFLEEIVCCEVRSFSLYKRSATTSSAGIYYHQYGNLIVGRGPDRRICVFFFFFGRLWAGTYRVLAPSAHHTRWWQRLMPVNETKTAATPQQKQNLAPYSPSTTLSSARREQTHTATWSVSAVEPLVAAAVSMVRRQCVYNRS